MVANKMNCRRCGKVITKQNSYSVKYKEFKMNSEGAIKEQWTTEYVCSKCNDEIKEFIKGGNQ